MKFAAGAHSPLVFTVIGKPAAETTTPHSMVSTIDLGQHSQRVNHTQRRKIYRVATTSKTRRTAFLILLCATGA